MARAAGARRRARGHHQQGGGGAARGVFDAARDEDGEEDFGEEIECPLAAWRAAHPGALVANVGLRRDHTDAYFAHLAGVKALGMWRCDQVALTDAAFAHLRGIHSLHMSHCFQATITGSAFAHLHGIHTLDMSHCRANVIAAARALGLPVYDSS